MGCGSSSTEPQKPAKSAGNGDTSPRSSAGEDTDNEPLLGVDKPPGARSLGSSKGKEEKAVAGVRTGVEADQDVEMTLPPCMSSLFIVEPLVLSKKNDGTCIYWSETFRCAAMVYGGYGMQILFISQILQWDLVCKPGAEQIGFILQVCCALTFEIAVFAEIRSSFDMLILLMAAPTKEWTVDVKKYLTAEHKRGAIVSEAEVGWLHAQVRRVRGKPRGNTAQWSMKKMNKKYKRWAILGVCIPKLLINISLSFVAGIWIPKSPDTETLLLNTLAVNFIVEVDHILYKAFVSDGTKQDLDTMTPIKRTIKASQRECRWVLVSLGIPFCVLFGSWLLVYVESKLSAACQESI